MSGSDCLKVLPGQADARQIRAHIESNEIQTPITLQMLRVGEKGQEHAGSFRSVQDCAEAICEGLNGGEGRAYYVSHAPTKRRCRIVLSGAVEGHSKPAFTDPVVQDMHNIIETLREVNADLRTQLKDLRAAIAAERASADARFNSAVDKVFELIKHTGEYHKRALDRSEGADRRAEAAYQALADMREANTEEGSIDRIVAIVDKGLEAYNRGRSSTPSIQDIKKISTAELNAMMLLAHDELESRDGQNEKE